MTRPGALLWFRYAFLGSLPARYREWVLHDATCSTWFLRHIGRVVLWLVVPEVVLVFAIPASGYIRALTAFTTGACVVLLMSILSNDVSERLVQRAGYPWGTSERVRRERAEGDQSRRAAAYRERAGRRHSR